MNFGRDTIQLITLTKVLLAILFIVILFRDVFWGRVVEPFANEK